MTGLTSRQRQFLDYVSDYIARKGFSPCYEEIVDALDLASKQQVHDTVERLVERGYLTRIRGKARSLAIVPDVADRLEQAIRGWARNRMREPLREILEEALRG
mgnify:CR=1 FL=1